MGRQVAYLSNDLFFRIRHGKQIQALHHTMKKPAYAGFVKRVIFS